MCKLIKIYLVFLFNFDFVERFYTSSQICSFIQGTFFRTTFHDWVFMEVGKRQSFFQGDSWMPNENSKNDGDLGLVEVVNVRWSRFSVWQNAAFCYTFGYMSMTINTHTKWVAEKKIDHILIYFLINRYFFAFGGIHVLINMAMWSSLIWWFISTRHQVPLPDASRIDTTDVSIQAVSLPQWKIDEVRLKEWLWNACNQIVLIFPKGSGAISHNKENG